jgi:FkbM family methyltransferase
MTKISKLLRRWERAPELLGVWRQTPAWVNLASRYVELGSYPYPCQIPLRGGGQIQIHSVEELKVFWQIFVRRCYRLPKGCRTIVDAGANVGLFAIWAAREVPSAQILSLEPCAPTFEILEKNIDQNNLQKQIRVFQCALAAQTGRRFLRGEGESPHRSLVLEGTPVLSEHVLPVPSLSLADFLKAEQLEAIDLLKMDIEGSEWEVLLSTSPDVLGKIQHIVLEYHEVDACFGYTPEKLIAHLASAGHEMTYREEDSDRTGLAFFQHP